MKPEQTDFHEQNSLRISSENKKLRIKWVFFSYRQNNNEGQMEDTKCIKKPPDAFMFFSERAEKVSVVRVPAGWEEGFAIGKDRKSFPFFTWSGLESECRDFLHESRCMDFFISACEL